MLTGKSPRVVTFGEAMGLATNDALGPLATSRAYTMSFGGAEANVAIALTRLGVDATWISRLGADPVGTFIARELRAEGVEVITSIDDDAPTGFMLKERRTSSMASVSFWRKGSAASKLLPEDVPGEALAAATLLHTTGIAFALSDQARDTAFDVLERAQSIGLAISFDVNHRSKLWNERDAAAVYERIIPSCSVVFAGDDEARMIVGDGEPIELAMRLRDLGAKDVVIKLGAQGCAALIDGIIHEMPARRVDVVDTVGAGDAFVAGYLAELATGAPAEQRLYTATATGAFACMNTGDWEGSPTRRELAAFESTEGISR